MFWIASLACSTVLTVPLRKMSCNFLGKQFSTCRVESVQVETIESLYIYIYIIRQGLHDMLISLNVSWLGLGHPQSCCISSGMVPSGPRSACRPSPLHGMEGTPAVCARMLASALRLYISRCDAMCLPTSSHCKIEFRNKTGTTFFTVHHICSQKIHGGQGWPTTKAEAQQSCHPALT